MKDRLPFLINDINYRQSGTPQFSFSGRLHADNAPRKSLHRDYRNNRSYSYACRLYRSCQGRHRFVLGNYPGRTEGQSVCVHRRKCIRGDSVYLFTSDIPGPVERQRLTIYRPYVKRNYVRIIAERFSAARLAGGQYLSISRQRNASVSPFIGLYTFERTSLSGGLFKELYLISIFDGSQFSAATLRKELNRSGRPGPSRQEAGRRLRNIPGLFLVSLGHEAG